MDRLTTFLGRFCVLAALIAAPWANVGADARNFRILLYLALASGIFAFVSLWTTPRRKRRTNSYWGAIATAVPLALGLALCVAQLRPLSDETLARVSPRVLELKAELTPPDFDEAPDAPTLDAFADRAFRPVPLLDEAEEAALRDALSEPFPFDAEKPLDLQSATAVDAAIERAFLPKDAPARSAWGRTISVYPLATREQLLIFAAAFLIFLAAAILFNSNDSRRFLWRAVALNGLAFALFCFAGKLNPSLYENETIVDWLNNKRFTPFETLWSGDETARSTEALDERFERDRHYGTYVCRNAAAGYLGLCLAPAVGLIVLAFLKTARFLDKERTERKREFAEAERWNDVYKVRRDAVWKRALGDFFDLFNRRLVLWLVVVGLILGAIFASMSRGGSVAAVVGVSAALGVLAIRKEGRRYWPALASAGAIAVLFLVWNGAAQRVDARMSTLVEEDEAGQTAVESDSRWQNWNDAAETWRDYPWFGSGLGTYRLANYRNDNALKSGGLFYYAENSLVQTRLEMGRVGVLLYVLAYIALLICVGRLVVGKRSRETLAVGCVGICLIVGQFIASMGDFGIYFPANIFLFAALCGSCVARKNVRRWEKLEAARASSNPATRTQGAREERRATRSELVGAVVWSTLAIGVLLGGRWALAESADAVERARFLAERDEIKRWIANSLAPKSNKDETTFFALPDSTTLESALERGRAFVERRDDSFEARAALAYLESVRFRVLQFETLRETNKTLLDEEIWAQTAPEYWTASLRHYRRIGFDAAAASIRAKEPVADSYPRILADWTAARRVCPLEPAAHAGIAETLGVATPIVWEREREVVELAARRIAAAAPFDSRSLFNVGRELFRVDAETLWPKFWRRTADFSDKYWLQALNAVELGVPASKQGTFIAEIAPNDPLKARKALTHFYPRRKGTPFFDLLLANARTVFEGTPEEARDAVYYFERASFNKFDENYEAAEADFRKALELRPDAVDVELQLAILLCEQTRLLQKDEECVKLLQKARAAATGTLARQVEIWAPRAERNLMRSQARAKRAERERARAAEASAVEADELDEAPAAEAVETPDAGTERPRDERLIKLY